MECRSWPVHCLTTKLSWLHGTTANRALALATAWGGSIDHAFLCSDERRLEAVVVGTKLACQIRAGAVSERVGALDAGAFSNRIIRRTQGLVEVGSGALLGELSLTRAGAWSVEDGSSGQVPNNKHLPSWTIWALVGVVAVLLVGVVGIVVGKTRKSQ